MEVEAAPVSSTLPLHILQLIFAYASKNEIATSVRLISKPITAYYSRNEDKTVRLSQPVPQHAFAWRWREETDYRRKLGSDQRAQLLCLTAASGDLDNLKVAIDCLGLVLTAKPLESAAAAGHLHICQWLLQQQSCACGKALELAAGSGHQDVCLWLLMAHQGPEPAADITNAALAACRNGHVDLMEYLLQQLPDPRRSVNDLLTAAAEGCDRATLEWLYGIWLVADEVEGQEVTGAGALGSRLQRRLHQLPQRRRRWPVVDAARSPTPDWRAKVEWLEELGCPMSPECCDVVAGLPDAVDRLTWLRQRGYPASVRTVAAAAAAGSTAALEYLLGVAGIRPDESCAEKAAAGGHLAALQLLYAHGCPLSAQAGINAAARPGRLAVVAWLVEVLGLHVSQLESRVMDMAAWSGSVELLGWLHERGCPMGDRILYSAAEGGSEAAVEWVVERGCSLQSEPNPFTAAARHGDLATLRNLRQMGCVLGSSEIFTRSVLYGAPVATLRWLLEEGCPVHWPHAVQMLQVYGKCISAEVAAWVREQEEDSKSKLS